MPYKIRLTGPRQRLYAHQLIDAAPDYSTVTIVGGDRTLDQNAKLWATLTEISAAKPEGRHLTPDVWKSLFMHALDHAQRFEMALDGKGMVPVGFRSSRMTKAQMADLIEFVNAYAAEHGIELHD